MTLKPRSLQSKLVLQLIGIFVIATVLGIILLIWQGVRTAASFSSDALRLRADELAQYVLRTPDGHYRMDPPTGLRHRYEDPHGENLFAIHFPDGTKLASGNAFALATELHNKQHNSTRFFQLENFDHSGISYYVLSTDRHTPAGTVWISVAHSWDTDEITEAILKQFALKLAWLFPLFAAIILLVTVASLRKGLSPVIAVSRQAAAITPGIDGLRLSTDKMPAELVPLVESFNAAIARLEQAITAQRRFTADAAHELRTPLTVLTAGLEGLPETSSIRALREDAARMNRLVEQLLRVARLDSIPVSKTDQDLCQIAMQTVAYMAPWAIAHKCDLCLNSPPHPVRVCANAEALSDALRNLIENAVRFSPENAEVHITVGSEGVISVEDHGPGIATEDIPHIFKRFWRGKNNKAPGAGLGLAIVDEIVRQHGGRTEVQNATSGGAVFRLFFRTDTHSQHPQMPAGDG